MTHLKTLSTIDTYIVSFETGIVISDAAAHHHREERATDLIANLTEAELHLDPIGLHEAEILRTAIGELRVQFALGKMEGTEKLHEIKDKIEQSMRRVKKALHQAKKGTADDVQEIDTKLHNSWLSLEAQVNLLDLRMNLALEKTDEKAKAAKEEVTEDLKTIRKLAHENFDDASEWVKRTKKSVSQRTHKIVDAMDQYLLGPPK